MPPTGVWTRSWFAGTFREFAESRPGRSGRDEPAAELIETGPVTGNAGVSEVSRMSVNRLRHGR